MYPVIHVPPNASEFPEALGTKPKFWYTNADATLVLYKEGRPDSGEHWSEKVCCELAELLRLPHAHYDLADWRGRKGVVSPSFVPAGSRLILGNEILARLVDAGYPRHAKRFRAKEHSVRAVMAVLSKAWVEPPLGFDMPAPLRSASAVFVGYLLLDALVGNQDRHHENWGLILNVPPGGERRRITLAPTYDHASSLGRNERDEERIRRLTTRDRGSSIEHYVTRASSAFFPTPASKPLSTMEAFGEAAKMLPDAALYWIERLRSTTPAMYYDVIASVPETQMSQPAREFALRMIELNKGRLLENRL